MRAKWVYYTVALIMILGICRIEVFSPQEVDFWVDDERDCQDHTPCFSSIQEAIDAVSAEIKIAKINILPGSYRENLIIHGKNVRLVGVSEMPIISALDPNEPAIAASGQPGETNFINIINLKIIGGSAGVQLLRTDGLVLGSQIMVTGEAGIGTEQVHSLDVRDSEIWGKEETLAKETVGIKLGEGTEVARIRENFIHDLGGSIDAIAGQVTINANRIEDAQIFVGEGVIATIEGNYLAGALGDRVTIMAHDVEEMTISRNEIHGGGILIGAAREDRVMDQVAVTHNLIMGSEMGINIRGGFLGEMAKIRAVLEQNTLQHNLVGVGVSGAVELTLRYNLLSNNDVGIAAPPLPYYARMDDLHVELEHNRFEGNKIAIAGAKIKQSTNRMLLSDNYISLNGYGIVIHGGEIELNRNRILYNEGYGLAVQSVGCYIDEPAIALTLLALGGGRTEVKGVDNEIRDNGQDLCPPDYPWPEGFVRGSE